MGEYGWYKGARIKLGTCEDMTDMRPDQIPLVRPETPFDLAAVRFRFPFPDEDGVEPGGFRNLDRGFPVPIEAPADADEIHGRIQFKDTHNAGVLVMLPCPYTTAGKSSGLKYMYNGYPGPSKVVQQRAWDGVWATVMSCGACGGLYRLGTLADALPVIEALIQEGDRRGLQGEGRRWHEMALRIRQGYETPTTRSL